ncbi:recombinase family protein [Lysinibacillus agricola]|uniref:recombinase family protein n=1 Tax=Lysinibacillus agricola TaxID=2590012 RepID=UPI003C1C1071
MTKKRAVIYGRVSTDKKEQEQSLDLQTISMQEQCVVDGYILEGTFAETGSATKVRNRKQFIELMKNCGLDFHEIQNGTDYFSRSKDRKSKYDIIYVKDTSRISRNTQQGIDIITQLKAQNIDVYFTNQFRKASEMDKDQIINMFNSAERESQATSQRIKYSKRKISEKSIYRPSKLSYGYMKQYHVETEKTYDVVINPNERAIVEEVFDMYINQDLGTLTIANQLNARNIPYRDNMRGWSDDKVNRMISNPLYHGSPMNHNRTKLDVTEDYYTTTNAEPIQLENAVEGIISKEIFEQAQEVKAKRTAKHRKHGIHKSKDNTYKGQIKCLHCGAPYIKMNNNNSVMSYSCSNKRKYGKDSCESKAIRVTQLNKYIEASPIHLDYSQFDWDYDRLIGEIKNAYSILKGVIAKKEAQKIEVENQMKSVMNAVVVVSSQPNAHSLVSELTIQHNQLIEQQEALQNDIDRVDKEALKNLAKRIEEKYEFLCTLKDNDDDSFTFTERIDILKEILIGKYGLKVTYNTPSFAEEIREFNTMFEGTEIQITWFNAQSEELGYYYYRHKGKDAFDLEEYTRTTDYDQSDAGLSILLEELADKKTEEMLEAMQYEHY